MKKAFIAIVLLFAAISAQQSDTAKQYRIDNNHSTIGFSVPIMGGLSTVTGKFTDFTINLMNDEKDITKSSVAVTIKTTSISTGIAARDNHLRTADFFDVEKYPEITFTSKSIRKKGKGFVAAGTFTMHGTSREIELPFTITGTEKDATGKKMNVGYAAHLTLNRREFGINWENPTVKNFVGDNVEIDINLITRAIDIP
jgi:polyisoprenoid-binding protein YceI